MVRRIIHIDEEKCNGCGLCKEACHEGAIDIIDGKARLTRDDYCDGFGDCLPACPAGAIRFEEREAAAYNEDAVQLHKQQRIVSNNTFSQFPVQIKLVPESAPYYNGAKLLVAADCTAFKYARIYDEFINEHIVLVGCPKLDAVDYSEKLALIIKNNDIKEIGVVRMEVPCCRGLELALKKAVFMSGKTLPITVTVISTDGKIVQKE